MLLPNRVMASSSQEMVLLLLDDKVVGMGNIFSTSPDDVCHGEVAGPYSLIVNVTEVFSVTSNLPFPSMGASTLMEARGSNILWGANEIKRKCPKLVAEEVNPSIVLDQDRSMNEDGSTCRDIVVFVDQEPKPIEEDEKDHTFQSALK